MRQPAASDADVPVNFPEAAGAIAGTLQSLRTVDAQLTALLSHRAKLAADLERQVRADVTKKVLCLGWGAALWRYLVIDSNGGVGLSYGRVGG